MSVTFREMTLDDYEGTVALWRSVPGVAVTEDDTLDGVAAFLRRNPGLSLAALDGSQLVGVVLCGHDGRRGYISHLAVADTHHRLGIGGRLVGRCIELLHEADIQKCHVFVFRENGTALSFWKDAGWVPRGELEVLSTYTVPPEGEQ